MAEERSITVGFVNIVASPHPAGVYPTALAEVASKPVRVRGNDWAIITQPKPVAREDGLYEGIISVWTDIDATEPSINKATFQRLDVEAALRKIFEERGFNNRSFSYVLDEQTHRIAVELKNEIGKTISRTGNLLPNVQSLIAYFAAIRSGSSADVPLDFARDER